MSSVLVQVRVKPDREQRFLGIPNDVVEAKRART